MTGAAQDDDPVGGAPRKPDSLLMEARKPRP